jgi:hypothetical protein
MDDTSIIAAAIACWLLTGFIASGFDFGYRQGIHQVFMNMVRLEQNDKWKSWIKIPLGPFYLIHVIDSGRDKFGWRWPI